ncbi:hypothetical protein GGR57DRAFT_474766 [Xylariaceae sp. FL1272]|nr:hypothetical protein GGR57DRAFT_474766 [Xylariaceae sp. FL1272]
MPITRVLMLAVPDAAAQDKVIATFKGFAETALKDGKPYILAARAAKGELLRDTTNGGWNTVASLTFASQADADYFSNEDPVNKAFREQAQASGRTGGLIAMQSSFD